MIAYLLRRLLLMIPTLFGIMAISFVIVQFAPGGPVERMIAVLSGSEGDSTARLSGSEGMNGETSPENAGDIFYRGGRGLDPAIIAELERQFGFDKPPLARFFGMIGNYATFDFGTSYFRDVRVIDLIAEKLPVSITLGLLSTLLVYLISIPLGIAKAVRAGTRFDAATSLVIVVAYAIPSFLLAILLIVLFAGGSFLSIFPLRGLSSPGADSFSLVGQMFDWLWHAVLPVATLTASGFATVTLLTRNSFIDEMSKHYVMTARAKGADARRVLRHHVFRNAMLIVLSHLPHAFIGIFFTGSLLIETVFSLDGLGLLSFESIVNRDYAVVFANLYIFSLIGLVVTLASDLVYMLVDPRIDFAATQT